MVVLGLGLFGGFWGGPGCAETRNTEATSVATLKWRRPSALRFDCNSTRQGMAMPQKQYCVVFLTREVPAAPELSYATERSCLGHPRPPHQQTSSPLSHPTNLKIRPTSKSLRDGQAQLSQKAPSSCHAALHFTRNRGASQPSQSSSLCLLAP